MVIDYELAPAVKEKHTAGTILALVLVLLPGSLHVLEVPSAARTESFAIALGFVAHQRRLYPFGSISEHG
jgi:hypothetical protein